MVPRIANRGHSFKGAGQYYLHDKEANTTDRVAWTHTHNLPTNDPSKAMKWMAYTDMNSSELKEKAGVKTSGRKAEKGSVYSYSLAWHPDDKPEADHMKSKALDTLELLGLKNHEAVIVAHQETDHDHVHVIVNLVNPETGKTAKVYKDHLKLSEWAETYEMEQGKIHCEKRVKNNEARKQKVNEKKIIKHREEKMERAQLVQDLYSISDSGKAFSNALEEQGYTIAKGDRRGFVLVDHNGEIYSLSRQLKGQRSADIKSRLNDLQNIPIAKELVDKRLYFDRDKYESEWQNEITKGREETEQSKKSKNNKIAEDKEEQLLQLFNDGILNQNIEYLDEFDRKRTRENNTQQKRYQLEQELDHYYDTKDTQKKIREIEDYLKKNERNIFLLPTMRNKLVLELEEHKKSLENINQRISEKKASFEKNISSQYNEKSDTRTFDQKKTLENRRIIDKKNRGDFTREL